MDSFDNKTAYKNLMYEYHYVKAYGNKGSSLFVQLKNNLVLPRKKANFDYIPPKTLYVVLDSNVNVLKQLESLKHPCELDYEYNGNGYIYNDKETYSLVARYEPKVFVFLMKLK